MNLREQAGVGHVRHRMREKYEADPLCSFTFTVNGYYQMFEGMKKISGKRGALRIPRTLPVLFVSGQKDRWDIRQDC